MKRTQKKRRTGFWQALEIIVLLAVLSFLVIKIYRSQILQIISQALATDTETLFKILVFVFIVGSSFLLLIYHWVDWTAIRFRIKRSQYRSQLVCPDYYKDRRRFALGRFFMPVPDAPSGKLDVDHALKNSGFIATDQGPLGQVPLQTRIGYKNGRLDGVFRSYFTNGALQAEVQYREGKLDGPFLVYYVNGFPHNEKYYRNGMLDGIFRAWDEDGTLFFEISYKNNVQHGFDKIYRKNGTLEYEDTYIEGQRVKRKTYDGFGRVRFVQTYDPDEYGNE